MRDRVAQRAAESARQAVKRIDARRAEAAEALKHYAYKRCEAEMALLKAELHLVEHPYGTGIYNLLHERSDAVALARQQFMHAEVIMSTLRTARYVLTNDEEGEPIASLDKAIKDIENNHNQAVASHPRPRIRPVDTSVRISALFASERTALVLCDNPMLPRHSAALSPSMVVDEHQFQQIWNSSQSASLVFMVLPSGGAWIESPTGQPVPWEVTITWDGNSLLFRQVPPILRMSPVPGGSGVPGCEPWAPGEKV